MMIIKPRNEHQRTIVRLEKWAREFDVLLEPIEEEDSKTADYKAICPNDEKTELFVEVKEMGTQFEVKSEDGKPFIEFPETESAGERFKPAHRVRNKIKKAAGQLQPYAKYGHPTLLLIGVWNPVIDRSLFLPLAIPIAMRGGGPHIRLGNSGSVVESGAQGGTQAAGKINRSISAIGRLECLEEQQYRDSHSSEQIVIYRHDNPKVMFPGGLPGFRIAGIVRENRVELERNLS